MVFEKMATIFPDCRWLGFQISYPIWNLDHLQTNLFLTIQNPDVSGFQILTVLEKQVGVLRTSILQKRPFKECSCYQRLSVKRKSSLPPFLLHFLHRYLWHLCEVCPRCHLPLPSIHLLLSDNWSHNCCYSCCCYCCCLQSNCCYLQQTKIKCKNVFNANKLWYNYEVTWQWWK